jgi:hypothetical protein
MCCMALNSLADWPPAAEQDEPDDPCKLAPTAHEQPPLLTAGLAVRSASLPPGCPGPRGQPAPARNGRHLRLLVGWIDLYDS